MIQQSNHKPSRRAFLRNGTLVLSTAMVGVSGLVNQQLCASTARKPWKVGLITDLHYADKPPAGTRHYRETMRKLQEAAKQFEKEQPALVVELGDFIDAADSVQVEQRYLKTINREFSALTEHRHYVLGNHCVDTLKKEEFLEVVEREKSYYSFDHNGVHFVILDACFRLDGVSYERRNFQWTDANIPPQELEWLQGDLASTQLPTIVFAHQRLDVATQHGVKNNARVREIMEGSGRVVAVFQGHSHKNDHKEINGIHYCTLVAMVEGSGVENNGYSTLEVGPDGTLKLAGFRQQESYEWEKTE